MAKPLLSFSFATDATFTSGPANTELTKIVSATPTQGFIPGTGVQSEPLNFMQNISGEWSAWLLAGTFNPDLDAHSLETNSLGSCAIAALQLGASAHSSFALVLGENTGGTQGLVFMDKASVGDPAFQGSSKSTTMFLTHDTGAGSGTLELESTASGLCLQLTQADITPLRPAINAPELSDPSAPLAGDFWKTPGIASNQRGQWSFRDLNGAIGGGGAGNLRTHASPGGIGYGYAAQVGTASESATVDTQAVIMVVDPPGNELRPGVGKYLINFSCDVRLDSGTAVGTRVKVVFEADGVPVNTYFIQFAAANQALPVSAIFEQDLSASTTFRVLFSTNTNTEQVLCENARISAQGSYDRT